MIKFETVRKITYEIENKPVIDFTICMETKENNLKFSVMEIPNPTKDFIDELIEHLKDIREML